MGMPTERAEYYCIDRYMTLPVRASVKADTSAVYTAVLKTSLVHLVWAAASSHVLATGTPLPFLSPLPEELTIQPRFLAGTYDGIGIQLLL